MVNVFDLAGSVGNGLRVGSAVVQQRRQNALADLYKTQGAGILAGDPAALNALAAQDPMQALSVQNTLSDNRRADEQLGMRRESHGLNMELTRERIAEIKRQAAAATAAEAARLDEATKEAERKQLTGILTGARTAIISGPEAWEQFKTSIPPEMWQQSGIDPAALTFEMAPAALAMVAGMMEGLDGGMDFAKGMQPEAQEPTAEMRNLEWRAQQAGLQPGTPEYADFMRAGGPAGPETVVNNNMPNESAFFKKTGEIMAQEAADVVAAGAAAQRNLGQIAQLEQLVETMPEGAAGALTGLAANLGLKVEGASDIELADAIINQLVPAQRPPGSGQMSDADLALFKRSLPRLINSRQGNRKIVQAMRAVAEYDVARANIARQLQLGQIDPMEASRRYDALGNPLRDILNAPDAPPEQGASRFDGMTAQDLLGLDISTMSLEELRARNLALEKALGD